MEGQSLPGPCGEVEARGCLDPGYRVLPVPGAEFVANARASLAVGRDRAVGKILVRAIADKGDQYSHVWEEVHRLPVRLPEARDRYREEVGMQRWTLDPEPIPCLVIPQKLVADGRERDSRPGVDLAVVAS